MGVWSPPLYGKSKSFYEKKKAQALKIIEEQKQIIKVCDEEIAKHEKN